MLEFVWWQQKLNRKKLNSLGSGSKGEPAVGTHTSSNGGGGLAQPAPCHLGF